MNDDELRKMELPGYWAMNYHEPISWVWVLLWIVWGLIVAGLILWRDGMYLLAGLFVAWGLLMGFFGWRGLGLFAAVVHDWAERHCTDPDVEIAAISEMFQALELERQEDDFSEEDFEIPDTPLQRQWMQQQLFLALLAIPWFMGLTHGVGIGGLSGALLALIPNAGFGVTGGAIGGAIIGATTVACVAALIPALLPLPKNGCSCPLSPRQRLLLLFSPILVVPALLEAAALWWRWYATRHQIGTARN